MNSLLYFIKVLALVTPAFLFLECSKNTPSPLVDMPLIKIEGRLPNKTYCSSWKNSIASYDHIKKSICFYIESSNSFVLIEQYNLPDSVNSITSLEILDSNHIAYTTNYKSLKGGGLYVMNISNGEHLIKHYSVNDFYGNGYSAVHNRSFYFTSKPVKEVIADPYQRMHSSNSKIILHRFNLNNKTLTAIGSYDLTGISYIKDLCLVEDSIRLFASYFEVAITPSTRKPDDFIENYRKLLQDSKPSEAAYNARLKSDEYTKRIPFENGLVYLKYEGTNELINQQGLRNNLADRKRKLIIQLKNGEKITFNANGYSLYPILISNKIYIEKADTIYSCSLDDLLQTKSR